MDVNRQDILVELRWTYGVLRQRENELRIGFFPSVVTRSRQVETRSSFRPYYLSGQKTDKQH